MQEIESVKNKRVFAYWQQNAYNSQSIMLKWIQEVCKKYSFWFKIKICLFLRMHLFTIQLIQKKKLKECEIGIRMIPSCLTLKLQPFDISVNKVLKHILRNKYVSTALRITNLKFLRTL